MSIKTIPLNAKFGCEVHGFDLSDTSLEARAELYQLLLQYSVLVFREQADLSPQAHLDLAASLGPLAPRHPMYPHVDGYEQILIINNNAEIKPENEVWHSDLSCRPDPPFAAVLKGVVIPPVGGDTLFADMRAAFDDLSKPMQAMLRELSARHDLHKGFDFVEDSGQNERLATLQKQSREDREAVHPVIVQHPANGREILYVNESFTTRIEGLTASESAALLPLLANSAKNPRYQVRVKWSPGTVLIWDNWSTQHFACGDHYPAVRQVQRATVLTDGRSSGFQKVA